MYLRSSDFGASSKTYETIFKEHVSPSPFLRMRSAMHTIEEESNPPLNSAHTGPSALNRHRTAPSRRWRKCSSYSTSVLYRILSSVRSAQNGCTRKRPLRAATAFPGGTDSMSLYGVCAGSGNLVRKSATYSSLISSRDPAKSTSELNSVDHMTRSELAW